MSISQFPIGSQFQKLVIKSFSSVLTYVVNCEKQERLGCSSSSAPAYEALSVTSKVFEIHLCSRSDGF